MNFTKEERVVLITIAAGILAGILISLFIHFPQKASAGPVQSAAVSYVNINSADAQELSRLPGIGASYAQRIIEYRTQNSGFKSVDELKNIKGIGEKKFEKLKRFVVLQ